MGNTLEAFEFYRSVFGGNFSDIHTFWEAPGMPGLENMSEKEKKSIMHISFPVLSNMILMGSDVIESFGQKHIQGNNFSLSLNVESKEEADKYFLWLSKNATLQMPLQDTFWGSYYGMLTDQFWVQWMVNYAYPQK